MAPARIQEEKATGYGRLSLYRSELMGAAMLWVMLFHAYPFRFGLPPLDAVKQAGFAGVDIFLLLSAPGVGRSWPPFTGGGRSGSCRPTGWWWGCTACG